LVLVLSASVNAQVGFQAGLAVPITPTRFNRSHGFGLQTYYKGEIGSKTKLGGSIGLFHINSSPGPNRQNIPILGTFDYSVSDKFYVGSDMGFIFIALQGGGNAGSIFAFAPKAGIKFNRFSFEGRMNISEEFFAAFLLGYSFGD